MKHEYLHKCVRDIWKSFIGIPNRRAYVCYEQEATKNVQAEWEGSGEIGICLHPL